MGRWHSALLPELPAERPHDFLWAAVAAATAAAWSLTHESG